MLAVILFPRTRDHQVFSKNFRALENDHGTLDDVREDFFRFALPHMADNFSQAVLQRPAKEPLRVSHFAREALLDDPMLSCIQRFWQAVEFYHPLQMCGSTPLVSL